MVEQTRFKKLKVPIIFVIVICCTLIWRFFSSSQIVQSLSTNSISTFTTVKGDFSDHIRLRGKVVPSKVIYLDAISGGRVEHRYIEQGSHIEKGEPLLQLSNPTLQLEVMSREAQVAEQLNFLRNTQMVMETNKLNLERDLIEIEYQLQQINRKVKRSIPLLSKGAIVEDVLISLQEELAYLEQRRTLTLKRQKQESSIREVQISQLEDSADMLQKNLSFARKNLENLLVTAPVSGYLSDFNVEIGETKSIGERLGQIDMPDEYKVVVHVDEYYLNKVALNATANIAINGEVITSHISKIDSRVTNSQFQIELNLPQGTNSIKIGQTLNVDLYLGETTADTLLIEQGAFYSTTGGHWIFVVDQDHNLAKRRNIKLGRKNQKYHEVLSGLAEGEQVIISSYETYQHAQKVELNNNI